MRLPAGYLNSRRKEAAVTPQEERKSPAGSPTAASAWRTSPSEIQIPNPCVELGKPFQRACGRHQGDDGPGVDDDFRHGRFPRRTRLHPSRQRELRPGEGIGERNTGRWGRELRLGRTKCGRVRTTSRQGQSAWHARIPAGTAARCQAGIPGIRPGVCSRPEAAPGREAFQAASPCGAAKRMGRDPVHDEAKAASRGHRQILPGAGCEERIMPPARFPREPRIRCRGMEGWQGTSGRRRVNGRWGRGKGSELSRPPCPSGGASARHDA